MILHRIDDITSLDPAETFEFADLGASRNMYQKLVNFDLLNLAAGYQPEVAESWTASEDGRFITVRIRECLRFHSGHPVTAEDAEFSLRRAVILNLPRPSSSPSSVSAPTVPDRPFGLTARM